MQLIRKKLQLASCSFIQRLGRLFLMQLLVYMSRCLVIRVLHSPDNSCASLAPSSLIVVLSAVDSYRGDAILQDFVK